MAELANELLEGTGWVAVDDAVITCPCGVALEWDADHCPECGERNPLIELGLL